MKVTVIYHAITDETLACCISFHFSPSSKKKQSGETFIELAFWLCLLKVNVSINETAFIPKLGPGFMLLQKSKNSKILFCIGTFGFYCRVSTF